MKIELSLIIEGEKERIRLIWKNGESEILEGKIGNAEIPDDIINSKSFEAATKLYGFANRHFPDKNYSIILNMDRYQ